MILHALTLFSTSQWARNEERAGKLLSFSLQIIRRPSDNLSYFLLFTFLDFQFFVHFHVIDAKAISIHIVPLTARIILQLSAE